MMKINRFNDRKEEETLVMFLSFSVFSFGGKY